MAKLFHLIHAEVGVFQEAVYIAEGNIDDVWEIEELNDLLEAGWKVSSSIDINDEDLAGFPTERLLKPY